MFLLSLSGIISKQRSLIIVPLYNQKINYNLNTTIITELELEYTKTRKVNIPKYQDPSFLNLMSKIMDKSI